MLCCVTWRLPSGLPLRRSVMTDCHACLFLVVFFSHILKVNVYCVDTTCWSIRNYWTILYTSINSRIFKTYLYYREEANHINCNKERQTYNTRHTKLCHSVMKVYSLGFMREKIKILISHKWDKKGSFFSLGCCFQNIPITLTDGNGLLPLVLLSKPLILLSCKISLSLNMHKPKSLIDICISCFRTFWV